ncbi:MAG: permease-like cell division protein FtsX [Polyangiaceae bacterium]
MVDTFSLAERAWRNGRGEWRLHALAMFSVSVAFVCLASALLVVTNLDAVQTRWSRIGRVTTYLRDGADANAVNELRHALERTQGVKSVRWLSAEEARRELVSTTGDATLASLPPQAFTSSLEIDFNADTTDNDVTAVATRLQAMPVVEGVETYARWSQRLGSVLQGSVWASLVLAAVVLGAVVSVVASTMRMALERRKMEVEVLKLVGASDSYVRGPFVVEGAVQGATGATMAVALIGALYLLMRGRFEGELSVVLGFEPTFLPLPAVIGLVALGAALGAASATLGVRRLSAI